VFGHAVFILFVYQVSWCLQNPLNTFKGNFPPSYQQDEDWHTVCAVVESASYVTLGRQNSDCTFARCCRFLGKTWGRVRKCFDRNFLSILGPV